MKFCIIFDAELSDELSDLKDGVEITSIETDIERININGIARVLPPKMPMNYYDFETYQTGYTKGFNDCLELLEGKALGEYDEEEIK